MRQLTTKDIFTFMPGHVRQRIADEIRKGNSHESMRAHLDAVKAINELNRDAAIRAERNRVGAQ